MNSGARYLCFQQDETSHHTSMRELHSSSSTSAFDSESRCNLQLLGESRFALGAEVGEESWNNQCWVIEAT